jgi:hypothetical protein
MAFMALFTAIAGVLLLLVGWVRNSDILRLIGAGVMVVSEVAALAYAITGPSWLIVLHGFLLPAWFCVAWRAASRLARS